LKHPAHYDDTHGLEPSVVVLRVALSLRIPGIPNFIVISDSFYVLFEPRQRNCGNVTENKEWLFPSTVLLVRYSELTSQ